MQNLYIDSVGDEYERDDRLPTSNAKSKALKSVSSLEFPSLFYENLYAPPVKRENVKYINMSLKYPLDRRYGTYFL